MLFAARGLQLLRKRTHISQPPYAGEAQIRQGPTNLRWQGLATHTATEFGGGAAA